MSAYPRVHEGSMSIRARIPGKIDRFRAGRIAFYLAFAIYLLVFAVSHTTFQTFFGIDMASIVSLRQPVVVALLATSILLSPKKLWQWLAIVVLVALAFVSWRMSGENWLFWLTLFCVSANGIRIKPLAWIVLVVSLGVLLAAVPCALAGIIDNVVVMRQGAERYSLGFVHPNTLGGYLWIAALAFSAIRFGKTPFPDLAVLAVVVVLNLVVTDSRATVIAASAQVVFLFVFYFVKSERARHVLSMVMLGGLTLAMLFSVYFMLFYGADNPVHALIDGLLSTRFSLAHGYFEMAPLTLFGNSFEGYDAIAWDNGEPLRFVVDNAFCHLILAYGLVPSLVFFWFFFAYCAKLVRLHRWDVMLFGLTVMGAYAFVETMGIRVEGNFFLIGMGAELLFGGNMLADCVDGTLSVQKQSKTSQHAVSEGQA